MTLADFERQTAGIAYQDRGMFFSEVYLFTKWCLERGVERIIESGVRNGVSTRLLHALWPGRVTSVEVNPRYLPPDFPYQVEIGDGSILVPQLIAASTERTGVLLDGPKKEHGHALRRRVLAMTPTVKVVGQHDVRVGQGEDFHTTDARYAPIRDALDQRIDERYRQKFPNGPGLAVWVR